MLIDTHCHLNFAKAFPRPEEALARARQAGVEACFVIGVDLEHWHRAIELAEKHEDVYAILGLHPNYAADYTPSIIEPLRKLLKHPKVKALGEIGLDNHWKDVPKEEQHAALRDQLDLAEEFNLPVVFHSREANSDLLDVLEKRPIRPYLFHCFTGSIEEAKRAVALGGYFGIDGPITYPKAEDLREMAKTLPLDRIVVETDSPYLSPAPYRGKSNEPAYVKHTCERLASTLGISFEQAAKITTENAKRFFGI